MLTGHFIEPYRDLSPLLNTLFVCIYFFHMPLFCLLSGTVAVFKYKKFFWKTLWIYISTELFYIIFQIFVLGYTKNINNICKEVLGKPFWHLWYLWAFIVWNFSIPILEYLMKKINKRLLVIALFSIGIGCGFLEVPGVLQRTVVFYVFFAIGFIYKDKIVNMLKNDNRRQKIRAMLALFGTLVVIAYFSDTKGINSSMLFNYEPYSQGGYSGWERLMFYLVSSAIVGMFCIIGNSIKSNCLTLLGQRTLQIYVFHASVFWILQKVGVYEQLCDVNANSLIIFAVVIFFVTLNIVIFGNVVFVNATNYIWNIFYRHAVRGIHE